MQLICYIEGSQDRHTISFRNARSFLDIAHLYIYIIRQFPYAICIFPSFEGIHLSEYLDLHSFHLSLPSAFAGSRAG